MFGALPIRYLSRTEEIFAQGRNFIGITLRLGGRIDVSALSEAFDTLLQAHPVLAGQLEPAADGRHQIVVDDYLHPGIWLEKEDPAAAERMPDQSVALVNLRVKLGDERSEVTLYTHHAMADAHHQFALLEQLFGWYTDLVAGGEIGPVKADPTPLPLEAVLEQRGVEMGKRSGLERMFPAMFAYELPPSRRNQDGGEPLPVRVPAAECRLSRQETRDLLDLCSAHRVSLNALLAAAILVAEWRLRGTPHIPIPYVYPVDLRYFLTPPVGATEATNPLGMAIYLAEIDSGTDVLSLATDIVESFRSDLADGVIQQSLLHFQIQYAGNPPGLPDVIMMTQGGELPAVRTPPGLEVEEFSTEVLFASAAVVDMYSICTYDGQLLIEYHTHAPDQQRYIAEIRDVVTAIPAQYTAVTD
ncbi:phthiocerol/phthiodiolone dimycocerosyl transferase family protein [Mycolicibacterium komossense]|uniref:Phthiocerol/phthiodiolone dimycocerosyl transferase n=1 Tax=Mycolicibacterium komossense TaxID=1779 RepID=A0ABT3CKP3_9MYCO|nr:acyltransferase [Mycolicibacterium komossense]MCV7230129.1 acyltransferase [Mycolicibacterium komossense]